ncbi:creatininase family protein [Carnimonas nigrificans]|uniref:creatininase family protein n=1 Tax=Carnimonas nigrificans TaxID=64323 RepID=UPI00046FBD7D|nr:creatininase family protein [Carnimonas nigrificans]
MLNGYTPAERFLPYLSWKQVAELPDKENTVIVLPAGAIEQHGPHLPCVVDSMIAAAVVGKALALLPSEVAAYSIPPLTYGKSDEHLHFPGTLTLNGTIFHDTVLEIGESLYRSGFRKLLIVNAHGGQPQPIEMAARELRLRHGDYVIISRHAWSVEHDDSFMDEWERRTAMHASHNETAVMRALTPELVNMELAPNSPVPNIACPTLGNGKPPMAWCARDFGPTGVIGDARGATEEQGEALLGDLTRNWAKAIEEFYRLQWPARSDATWARGQFTGDVLN